jgi:GAF domain-containing protein
MTNVCLSAGVNGKSLGMTQPRNDDLAQRMAELARASAAPRSVEDVLSDVTAAAMELIPGADTAGVLLIGKAGKWDSVANTSDLPRRLDELQMMYNEGPCVEAALDELIVRTDNFRSERRWPEYSAAVVEIGVLSGLSFKLYTSDRTAGALNLFSFKSSAFDAEDETTGVVLAAHAAAAILASRQGEQLESALSTRDRIGQAKGIIMERYGIDDLQAFDMLRRLSQDGNTRLIEIAQRVIDTRAANKSS